MSHGVIDGFSGSWSSGLGYLVIDGQPVPGDNAATVRALEACFGSVMAPGHLVDQQAIVGQGIWYSVSPWGVLEAFSPAGDNHGDRDGEEAQHDLH
jgi:hypothetical protein